MNLKRLLTAIVVLLVAYATPVLAQDKQVTGKVTDSKDGSPLAGATVKAKGTTVMAQSGNDGVFKFKVPAATNTLVVSYVGFADKEVAIVGETVNVNLQAANGNLTEMVVVAYGTRRKSDLTGAVTSVSAKDFQKGNIASPEQLLQGKVAGLQITTGGGSAGGGSRIRIGKK